MNCRLNLAAAYVEIYKNSEYTADELENKMTMIREITQETTGKDLAKNRRHKTNEVLEKAKLRYNVEKTKRTMPKTQTKRGEFLPQIDLRVKISRTNKRSRLDDFENNRYVRVAKTNEKTDLMANDNEGDEYEGPRRHEILDLEMQEDD